MGMTENAFLGCVLGLALGDALGAPYEGGPLEHLLWRVIGRTGGDAAPRWTDDTQMSIDIAETLLEHGRLEQQLLAQRFAASYRWDRGYGPGAARVLKKIRAGMAWQQAARSVYPQGSFGNGAAMRAPVIALFYPEPATLLHATRLISEITHAHPLALEGAQLMALSTHLLLQGSSLPQVLQVLHGHCQQQEFASRMQWLQQWLQQGYLPAAPEIVQRLGNGITAQTSVLTAIFIALSHLQLPFGQMLAQVRALGGDVDTIGAMAGALWGAANGVETLMPFAVEQKESLLQLAQQIYLQGAAVNAIPGLPA